MLLKKQFTIISNPATNDIIQFELLLHHFKANGRKTNDTKLESMKFRLELIELGYPVDLYTTPYPIVAQ